MTPYDDSGDLPVYDAPDEYIEDIDAQLVALHETFRVENERDADWVLNKMKGWQDEIARRNAACAAETAKLARKIAWFELRFGVEIERLAHATLFAGTMKSMTLPCGVQVGYRKQPHVIAVDDTERYEHWVRDHLADAYRVIEVVKIDKKLVNKTFKETGEIPDGTHVDGGGDKFYMRLS